MTRLNTMLAAGALSLAAATAAFAQATDQTAGQPAPAPASDTQAQSAGAAAANTSASVATPQPQGAGVQQIQQGDNTLVTNGPIPDTPENRAKFGGPMSMTGKRTKPAGN